VQLRTGALEGFSGTPAQLSALAADLPDPTLACLIRNGDQPARLELASSLDVRGGNKGGVPQVLAMAACAQAAEAWLLSQSKGLALTGLTGSVKLAGELPPLLSKRWDVDLHRPASSIGGSIWAIRANKEISDCVAALRDRATVRAVRTPWGICATLPFGCGEGARSILEVNAEAEHPRLGYGLLVTLTTPARGGPLEAMASNAHEVGPWSRGDALGGWVTRERVLLVHRSFYPSALLQEGFALRLLLGYARRACEADRLLRGALSDADS
jgi:hypothetical protein